jgi:glutamate--cysteine ligase catalytic subunit
VVVYSEDNQRVLLSLRQAEILEALATDKELEKQGGCVPDLQDVDTADTKKKYIKQILNFSYIC